ncbi:maleylpyruvate isomerase N-terminal domain-containing protein [Amycolatopsis kentuckyensis]|uniref:maleylpyruvate isomerase N-terminal domain-containing protein n=1 Tax=Amycolatopsis kentuckyensis TaxID=218823 RepID=UPI003566C2AD
MTELSTDQARRAIIDHTRQLAEAAIAAGPGAAVPTAPAWTVSDLVAHIGQTQHWVAEIIERRITDPTQLPTELPECPPDPANGEHGWRSPHSASRPRVPMTRWTHRCSTPRGTNVPERSSG